jgi:signal transduction histidine kinase
MKRRPGGRRSAARTVPTALPVLREIYSVLAGEPKLDRALRHLSEKIAAALGAHMCAFLLYDDASRELVAQPGAWGPPKEKATYRVRVDEPLTSSGRVFLTRQPMLSRDAERDPRVNPRFFRYWNCRSLIVAPLTAGHRTIGVLRVGHREPGVFTRDHLRLAAFAAEQAAVVLENARLYRRIREDVRELRRLSALKSQLLSTVSHDLLSPLSSVEGFLVMLLDGEAGPLTDRQKGFLSLCGQALRRVTALINDLLDHSRIEAGVVKVRPEPVDLGELLSAARQDHAVLARKKRLAFSFDPPKDLPRLSADPHRLRQVLDNLLSNAFKFTPEGGRVVLSARAGKREVVVSVKDSGVGLSPLEARRVFDRFYQVEKNISARARGTGLGLSICKALVERHGGRIWVDSVPGRGSDFQFTLPVSKPA